MINITTVSKEKELLEILKIQKNNHKGNISEKEALDNGFLSVLHTSEALNEMNRAAPQIIALDGDKVAGFA
ncbi:MAG: GNAT family N-acetyltransferase, partial [Cytophagaceae bacterium]